MYAKLIPNPSLALKLTDELQKDAEREYNRIKNRMKGEDFALFDEREDFKAVLGLSDFIASTLFSYPDECALLLKNGYVDRLKIRIK